MAKKKKKTLAREVGEIIVALLVAWAFYQALAFTTGSPLPVVSVVSSSMHHEQNFDEWWETSGNFYENKGITKSDFEALPMSNGFSIGDLLFVVGEEPSVGDVIIYQRSSQNIIIVHRIVEVRENSYVTKGDNNSNSDEPIEKDAVFGKALFAIPLLGYPRTLLHMAGI